MEMPQIRVWSTHETCLSTRRERAEAGGSAGSSTAAASASTAAAGSSATTTTRALLRLEGNGRSNVVTAARGDAWGSRTDKRAAADARRVTLVLAVGLGEGVGETCLAT